MAKRRGIKGTSGRVIQPWHFAGSTVCHDNAGCEDGRDPHHGERLPGQAESRSAVSARSSTITQSSPLGHGLGAV